MSKIFRIDWYPHQAYVDYSRMDADEIAVMSQIINLIYMNENPIDNDPKWISRSIRDMGPAKCRNVIDRLIHRGELSLDENGKISKKMCENQLKNVSKRREFYRDLRKKQTKSGENLEFFDSENEENQTDRYNVRQKNTALSTNTNTNTIKTPTPISKSAPASEGGGGGVFKNGLGEGGRGANFNIGHKLSDQGLRAAKNAAPGWDIYHLMGVYNEGIHSGKREPPKAPDKAFPAWCARYTKGKSP